MTGDPYDLQRFVKAQAPVHAAAMAQLRAGRKTGHWMWFVFPQLRGLGRSEAASFYGIGSLDEARAYLAHPVLGPRLRDVTMAALAAPARSIEALFGSPDDTKFRSSMTLFALAAEAEEIFQKALDRWCGGTRDAQTCRLLGISPS
ncbi:MAG: DUF1810 domain-containing protein [Flavobacteriaceae bacterium]